jgi:hypothetical protein
VTQAGCAVDVDTSPAVSTATVTPTNCGAPTILLGTDRDDLSREVATLSVLELNLSSNTTMRVRGPRPLVIYVHGNATLFSSVIDANADAGGFGPGAGSDDLACAMSEQGLAGNDGGGGGANGSSGGRGGGGAAGSAGGTGSQMTVPPMLRAGCRGGDGVSPAQGGGGGGSIVIVVARRLSAMGARIEATGAGGSGGPSLPVGGAGGGGSGGMITLQARTLTPSSILTLDVRGGGGGGGGIGGGTVGDPGRAGSDGGLGGSGPGGAGGSVTTASPYTGGDAAAGTGGGAGGAGFIWVIGFAPDPLWTLPGVILP